MTLSRFGIFLLLLSHHALSQNSPSESGTGSDEEGLVGDYIYAASDEDPENVFPVIDFLASESSLDDKAGEGEREERPDFLYSTKAGHRIVEFYAPWCWHCRHFKDHFISFSRKITKMARDEHQEVSVHAVSCTAHKSICQDQGVTSFPTIKVLKAGTVNGTVFEAWNLHPFAALSVLDITSDNFSYDYEEEDRQLDQKMLRIPERHVATHIRTKGEVYRDASASFDFAMRNSIFTLKGPLRNETRDTFHAWIELLSKTLPPTLKTHRILNEILENMDEVVMDEKHLIAIVDQHPLDKKGWSTSCTHGDKFAGYTCGLWELFHIITIGLVEWNALTGDDWNVLVPIDAAERLRNYIDNFFGCEVCRLNFLAMYDSCSHNRCERMAPHKGATQHDDWIQLAVWLWEVHNSVNVRLMKERAEREHRDTTHQDELDAEWPSRSECPRCWRPDETWDEELIYKYLRLQYW